MKIILPETIEQMLDEYYRGKDKFSEFNDGARFACKQLLGLGIKELEDGGSCGGCQFIRRDPRCINCKRRIREMNFTDHYEPIHQGGQVGNEVKVMCEKKKGIDEEFKQSIGNEGAVSALESKYNVVKPQPTDPGLPDPLKQNGNQAQHFITVFYTINKLITCLADVRERLKKLEGKNEN